MLSSLRVLTGRPTQAYELSTTPQELHLFYRAVVRCHSVSNSAARVTITRRHQSTGATAIDIGVPLSIVKPVRT